MLRVAVTYGAAPGWVYVRPLRGDDEESVDGTETQSAILLLDRLLLAVPGAAAGPGEASALTAADRDRVLAAIYRREIGARVASTPVCPACRAAFDLAFELGALLSSLDAGDAATSPRRDAHGEYVLTDGTRFRIPSGADELIAAGAVDPARALLERCGVVGPASVDEVAEAMARIAPLVEAELDTACPACGHEHAVRFDIQSFLLGLLIAERRQRTGDVQRLARAFGWSLTDILGLSRAQRRVHVELIERAGAR